MKNFLPIQRATAVKKYKKGYPIFIFAQIEKTFIPVTPKTHFIFWSDLAKFYYKTHN